MAILTEETKIDKIEIVGEYRAVQVRKATQVYRDDLPIGNPEYYRYVILAGQDYSEQPDEVQAVCSVVHTPEVIEAFRVTQAVDSTAEPVEE